MEPTHCHKRKRNASPTTENTKRVKETECNGLDGTKHLPRPPRLSVPFHRLQELVTLKELKELLHFASLGETDGVKQPSWCHLYYQRRVKGVNVVILEGLTQAHFYRYYMQFKHLQSKYTTRRSFTPSPGNLASEIFSSEVPDIESSDISHGDQKSSTLNGDLWLHPVIRKFGTKTLGLTGCVVSQEEMIKKNFPVKGMPGSEGFVCTDSDDYVTDSSPLYGLDCEMCLTEQGYELTRLSLVDSGGRCVLDELVKPQNRILCYLTRFSGITRVMLQPITTTLREVQSKIKQLLPRNAVLVGHSLDNDLRALKLIHPHVIDTSLLYRRELGQRFKLKVLAETVLKKEIQSAERNGHDPTEDAQAALELAQYFIHTGPRKVVELHLEELWGGTPTTHPSPVNRTTHKHSNRFSDILQRSGHSVVFIGRRADITLALSNQLWHSSDKEVLSSSKRGLQSHSFSVVQFSSFSDPLRTPSTGGRQHYQKVCARLREMCVVFAGPFPEDYTERDVRKLFGCCGPVRTARMLNTTQQVHAEVEFELLEGAQLAVETCNGITVHGRNIKVQRPVKESTLDLDITLSSLQDDPLNANTIYAAGLKSNAKRAKLTAKVNGTGVHANGAELRANSSGLSEEDLRETFGQFGAVRGVVLSTKKCRRHAFIKYKTSVSVEAVLSSPVELWDRTLHTCRALTPPHLRSWVTMTTPKPSSEPDGGIPVLLEEEQGLIHNDTQEQEIESVMRKLDGRVGNLFRALPDNTLSVVLLPGHTSSHGDLPGLCFMEIRQRSTTSDLTHCLDTDQSVGS